MHDRGRSQVKAVVLGGFAASAALCACLCLVGFAWFIAVLFTLNDSRGSGSGGTVSPLACAALTLSFVASSYFGCRVARDWYHNGR